MKREPRHRGFTLVELLVVVGIIAVLVSILLPVLGMARESGRCSTCLSNLRQIGHAFQMYANDHNDYLVPGDYLGLTDGTKFPSPGNWAIILVEGDYLPDPAGQSSRQQGMTTLMGGLNLDHENVFKCPDYTDVDLANCGFPTSQTDIRGAAFTARRSDITLTAVQTWYAVNCCPYQRKNGGKPLPMRFLPDYDPSAPMTPDFRPAKLTSFNNVSTLPLVFDGAWTMAFDSGGVNYDPNRINARHYNGRSTNVLFGDGHCETDSTPTLPNNDWYCQ